MQRLEHLFVMRSYQGLYMDLDPWEWSQNQIRRNRVAEPLTTNLYERLLVEGDTYVDVGAHVGFSTLVARSLIGEKGKVIAIEPQPYNCAKILRNWGLNDFTNCIVCVCAATDHEGGVFLHDQPSTDRARLSLNGPSVPGDAAQAFWVATRRLDSVIYENGLLRIKILKIDVEGHELQVVRSLGETIAAVDNFVIEVWDAARDEYRQLAQLLTENGFRLRNIKGEPWQLGNELPELNLWASRV
jgi:FkbM family methyltransferase